jgi:hypothetical protein
MPPLEPDRAKPQLRPEALPAAPRPEVDRASHSRGAAYYSQPPNLHPDSIDGNAPSAPSSPPWRRLVGAGLLVAAALVASAWYGLAPSTPPAPASVAAATDSQQKIFAVSAAELDQRATDALKALLASGAVPADDLHAENSQTLLQLATASPQMAADIQADRTRLYRINLLDFADQDGDHVELTIDGLSFGDVNLSNSGASILVPLTAGKPVTIKLLATADGGGGVTVGFLSSLGEARTMVLNVGGADQWQVILK